MEPRRVIPLVEPFLEAGTARWLFVGLPVLLDAASSVPTSSRIFFSGREDFSLGVNMGSDSIPHNLFRMRA